tara:strand:+ start:2550 stop:4082 length:1533 start_codon:yes stop_codon:yes gene_type:complete
MALPEITASGNKEVAEVVKDIGQAIFKRAGTSLQAAAQAVMPNIPSMVAEITEDLRSGPVSRFAEGIRKLDKLVDGLGVNLEDYSKELAEFLKLRQQKTVQSEETINELRKQNIIAQVNEVGDVQILTRTEVEKQEKRLIELNDEIKTSQKNLNSLRETRQEDGDARSAQQRTILKVNDEIIDKTRERAAIMETLNKKEDTDTRTFRQKFGDAIDEYVPDSLRDIGSAFTEGLMAPFTAVKELGGLFGNFLKPLKALPKLFKGFVVGMKSAVASFMPFILIAAAIVIGLIVLKLAFDKLKEKIEENKEKLIEFKDRIMEVPGQIKDFFKERFDLLKKNFDEFKTTIKEVPGDVKDFFDKKFGQIGKAFDTFVENIKAIPGKITDFFTGVFNKIQNFFIDIINGAIDMFNNIPGIPDLTKLENVPMPEPMESPVIPGSTGTMAEAKAAMTSDKSYTNEDLTPQHANEFSTNNSVIDGSVKTNVSNNTTLSSFMSSKNDDRTRIALYSNESA